MSSIRVEPLRVKRCVKPARRRRQAMYLRRLLVERYPAVRVRT